MSKQITTMGRLTGQIERIVRELNKDFFDGALPMPTVTVVPTAKAYAHLSVDPIWEVGEGDYRHELNVSSAYLDRGIEYICASVLHELVHLYDLCIVGVQDTSNNGTYHNRLFREAAESHGLICTKTRYGWSDTSTVLSDTLLDWVLLHDEFREIELNRNTPGIFPAATGPKAAAPIAAVTKSNSIRWVCPECGMIARTTRSAFLVCGDCLKIMERA